jgi:hypothetical protein
MKKSGLTSVHNEMAFRPQKAHHYASCGQRTGQTGSQKQGEGLRAEGRG